MSLEKRGDIKIISLSSKANGERAGLATRGGGRVRGWARRVLPLQNALNVEVINFCHSCHSLYTQGKARFASPKCIFLLDSVLLARVTQNTEDSTESEEDSDSVTCGWHVNACHFADPDRSELIQRLAVVCRTRAVFTR